MLRERNVETAGGCWSIFRFFLLLIRSSSAFDIRVGDNDSIVFLFEFEF
ncbi:hypothetical protein SAMN05421636_1083 [Pricia antarctica]|uniref:Uncharacterized protein n=1 Tax=Pricia antarctica TaxID=641691 RepID=A0A1G7G7D6_9FLAO|nr:hypothetical protein SAMN05421636_1083 [Pricia antarctica]